MSTKKQKASAPDYSKYLSLVLDIIFRWNVLSVILIFLLASWGVFGDLPDF